MSRRAAAILLAVLAAAVAALILVNRGDLARLARRPRPFLRVTPAPPPLVTAAPGATPVPAPETVRAALYFPDQNGMLLHTEQRDIHNPTAAAPLLHALFAELQQRPT